MKNDELTELMYLSMYGEISEEERQKLDEYLKKHPEAKKELNNLKKFRTFISGHTSDKTTDALLDDARRQFRTVLRSKRQRTSMIIGVLIGRLKEFLTPKFALTGVGALSLGVLIGYCSFSVPVENALVLQPVSDESARTETTRIENIRFIDSDESDGEVEFSFDAVAPMKLKGKVGDPEIQRILTHALLTASNDGVRLSSVNTIGRQIEGTSTADPSVRTALITTLKSDQNPGVRREALRVLQACSFGNDIRDAFLFVLTHDENSGMRVAAINALETAKMDGNAFDRSTADALNKQLEKEQNHYIRNRAATLVKEIYQ